MCSETCFRNTSTTTSQVTPQQHYIATIPFQHPNNIPTTYITTMTSQHPNNIHPTPTTSIPPQQHRNHRSHQSSIQSSQGVAATKRQTPGVLYRLLVLLNWPGECCSGQHGMKDLHSQSLGGSDDEVTGGVRCGVVVVGATKQRHNDATTQRRNDATKQQQRTTTNTSVGPSQ